MYFKFKYTWFVIVLFFGVTSSPAMSEVTKNGRIDQLPNYVHDRLGLAFPGKKDKYYYLLQQAGLGVVRIGVNWSFREPRAGKYNWKPLDKQVIALQKLGIKPFLTLYSDAKWGTKKGRSVAKNKPPKNLKQWDRFVADLVERYDGDGYNDAPGLLRKVEFYQVANEWISEKNKSGGWDGSADELIDFINVSYDAVKRSDKDASFVMGGIAAFNLDLLALLKGISDRYVYQKFSETKSITVDKHTIKAKEYQARQHEVYRVLESTKYDFADIHIYGESLRNKDRVKAMLSHIDNKPMLSSECGGPSLDYKKTYKDDDHFVAVFDWNLSTFSLGLEYCLWFQLGEGEGSTWGNRKVALFDTNEKPKPGFFAYRLLSNIMADFKEVEQLDENLYKVDYQNGKSVLIGWGPQNSIKSSSDVYKLLGTSSKQELLLLSVTDAKSGRYRIEDWKGDRSSGFTETPMIFGPWLPESLY